MATEKSNAATAGGPLRARDVMTSRVITAAPDAPARDVARLLLENGISAVPIVDGDGTPVGMVSEGDLIGRGEIERLSRRDWWLTVMTGSQALDDDFLARLGATDRSARDVMSAPLVTVTEQTGVSDIARLLAIHHIKRVPVIRDEHIVGIVSRADLLRVVAATQPTGPVAPKPAPHPGFLAGLFGGSRHPAAHDDPPGTDPAEKPRHDRLTADDFRELEADFHSGEVRHKDEARRAAAEQRKQRAKDLIDAHVFDDAWRSMLHHAETAAENGEKQYLLLRFPNQLCLDGGRAINVAEADWPGTLRGEAAEIYLRWERDLKHTGFSLTAEVLEFPDGKPGDIGLFLVWGGAVV
ncbi:MAG TPA: CBS domain-containing protein [Rhodopila sp.]